MSAKAEEPSYEVLKTLEEGVEIRKYGAQIRASSQTGRENRSFGILAEYIFGRNDKNEQIGMTASVITSGDKMSFVMPRRYSIKALPKPLNDQIKIHEVDEIEVAVLRFSGFTSPKTVDEKTGELIKILETNEIKIDGLPFLMRYNPPWTLPFLRRNEVAIKIEI